MGTTNDTYCVYAHINKINGKIYIGQTVYGNDPNRRWQNGVGYTHCSYFWNAIQKYGWDNFQHIILLSNLSYDDANYFEENLIRKLGTTDSHKGYNLKFGGDNRTLTDEHKSKIGKANKGKKVSDETRKKMSKSKIGINHPKYGKHLSEEHKARISNANKGKHRTHIQKKRISEAHKGKMTGANNPRAKAVICLDVGIIYHTAKEAEDKTGVNRNNICACCKNRLKTAGGYHWAYYDRKDNN